ncbi:hypothetical protein AAC387_Pa01g0810 [Persea americana]
MEIEKQRAGCVGSLAVSLCLTAAALLHCPPFVFSSSSFPALSLSSSLPLPVSVPTAHSLYTLLHDSYFSPSALPTIDRSIERKQGFLSPHLLLRTPDRLGRPTSISHPESSILLRKS